MIHGLTVDQFPMRTLLDDAAFVQHQNLVCVHNGAEPVCDHDCRSTFKHILHVLENVAFEDIQVTNASLAEAHGKHKAKRHDKEEELDESANDDLVNEVLRRVVARLANK